MSRSAMTFKTLNAQLRIKKIIAALAKPITCAQLCDVVPMTKESANNYLAHLREEGHAYISGQVVKPGAPALIHSLVKEKEGAKEHE